MKKHAMLTLLLIVVATFQLAAQSANQKLSNLVAPTAINQSLLPNKNNSLNLGSAAKSWQSLFLNSSIYFSDIRTILADTNNTAIGLYSLYNNTTAIKNTATGYKALYSNLGDDNEYNYPGEGNTANGYNALYSNTQGGLNSAFGYNSLFSNTDGLENTAIGTNALYSNDNGDFNVAIGSGALSSHTRSISNIAIGFYAAGNSTFGDDNIAIGYTALENTTGSFNIAIGNSALLYNTTGGLNTVVGWQGLYNNTTGNNNTVIGSSSLYGNTIGSYNTSLGSGSMFKNTTGDANTATGYNALYSNSTGKSNTANGFEALYNNTTGVNNTATGKNSLLYNTTGNHNAANGYAALAYNTTGSSNTGIGDDALLNNTTGYYNTAIGSVALSNNTTASGNTAIGYSAGNTIGPYNYNTYVGYDADATSNQLAYSYSTAVGYGSRVTGGYQMRFGNSSTQSIGGYKDWSVISDGRFKKNIKENVIGLSFINKLRPVTYTLDIHAINTKTDVKENSEEAKAIAANEQVIHSGLIAQEVEKVSQETGFVNDIVDKPKNDNDMYGIRYAEVVVPLIKAVQELSKQNDELTVRLQKVENLLSNQSITNSATIEGVNKAASSFITVYPNPVRDMLYIQSKSNVNFSLSDANGKTVITKQISGNGSLDVSKLSAGTYFLRNDVDNEVQKVVVGK